MKTYDHLKKNLRNYSVEVDKEKLWQQTMHAIPKKKKRNAASLLLLLGILMLIGALTFNTFQPSFTYAGFKEDINSTSSENSIAGDKELQTFTSTSDQFKIHQPPSNHAYPSGDVITNHVEDQFAQNRSSTKHLMNSSNNPGMHIHHSAFLENAFATVPTGNEVNTNLEELTNESALVTGSIGHRNVEHWNAGMIDPLPLNSLAVLRENPFTVKQNSIKPTVSRPKNIFSLSLLQGIGFSSLSFDPGNEEAKELGDFISASTRSLESFTTSVSVRLDLEKGFSFSTGLSFSQLTTETTYQFTQTDRLEREGTSTILIDETGHQNLVSGNIGSTRYTDLEATRYTHHQSIAFELLLHKTLFKIKHATINGYLKGGINAWYAAEGTAFTDEKVPVHFTSPENPYRLDSPWLYGFGLDIQYRMTPGWILYGMLGYDHKDIYHMKYNQLKWKHSIYSLSLGMGYVF